MLSSSVMTPLSRLSYLVFLLHPVPIYVHVASVRESFQLDHYYMVSIECCTARSCARAARANVSTCVSLAVHAVFWHLGDIYPNGVRGLPDG